MDSCQIAFEMAAHAAYRQTLPKCGPQLLEPIMKVDVFVPDDYVGDVIGDLNRRRGMILGQDTGSPASASRLTFRSPKCSATSATCVPRPLVAASSRWSSATTLPARTRSSRRSRRRSQSAKLANKASHRCSKNPGSQARVGVFRFTSGHRQPMTAAPCPSLLSSSQLSFGFQRLRWSARQTCS